MTTLKNLYYSSIAPYEYKVVAAASMTLPQSR